MIQDLRKPEICGDSEAKNILFRVIIPGRPYVKKNNQRAVGNGKFKRIIYSPQYKKWEGIAHAKILESLYNAGSFRAIIAPVNMCALFYFANRQAEPDLSALYEGIQDVLQKAGVIENDKLIYAHDGSRKIFGQEPRVEIELTAMEIK